MFALQAKERHDLVDFLQTIPISVLSHDSTSEHFEVKCLENTKYFLYIKTNFNMLFSITHLLHVITHPSAKNDTKL